MRKILVVYCLFFFSIIGNSQELNCTLVINAEQTGRQNQQIFSKIALTFYQ